MFWDWPNLWNVQKKQQTVQQLHVKNIFMKLTGSMDEWIWFAWPSSKDLPLKSSLDSCMLTETSGKEQLELSTGQEPLACKILPLLPHSDAKYWFDDFLRFSLGTRLNVNRYIQQFTEIFTEEGRKSVKITHQVQNQPPRVMYTQSMREKERLREKEAAALQLQQQQQTQQQANEAAAPVVEVEASAPTVVPVVVNVINIPQTNQG